MANTAYNLTANIQIQKTLGLTQQVRLIQSELNKIHTPAFDRNAIAALNRINAAAQKTTASIRNMATTAQSFSFPNLNQASTSLGQLAKVQTQFAATSVKAGQGASILKGEIDNMARASVAGYRTFPLLTAKVAAYLAVLSRTKDMIAFQKGIADIANVAGTSTANMQGFGDTILDVSRKTGVSSKSISGMAQDLLQANFSVKQTTDLMEVLAKTSLTPSFKDTKLLADSVIVLRETFQLKEINEFADGLEKINRLSLKTAVDADDLAEAMKRSGASLKNQGNSYAEILALAATAGSATKSSGQVTGNALKTIGTRVSSPETRAKVQEITGIDLAPGGKQIGMVEMIEKLSEAQKRFPEGSVKFQEALRALAGGYQVNQLQALINNVDSLRKNLLEASEAGDTIEQSFANATGTLDNKLSRLNANLSTTFNEIGKSRGFQTMTDGLLGAANAATDLTRNLTPLVPLIAGLAAARGLKTVGEKFGPEGGLRNAVGGMIPTREVPIGSSFRDRLRGTRTASLEDMRNGNTIAGREQLLGQLKAYYAVEIATKTQGLRAEEIKTQALQRTTQALNQATTTILQFDKAGKLVKVTNATTQRGVDWRRAAGGAALAVGLGAATWAANQDGATGAAGSAAVNGFSSALVASSLGLNQFGSSLLGGVTAILSFANGLNEARDKVGEVKGQELGGNLARAFEDDPLGKGTISSVRALVQQQALDFAAKDSGDRTKMQFWGNTFAGVSSWASGKGFGAGYAENENATRIAERQGFINRNRGNLDLLRQMRDAKVAQSKSYDEFAKGGGLDILAAIDLFDDGLQNSAKAMQDKIRADIEAKKATEARTQAEETNTKKKADLDKELADSQKKLAQATSAALSAVERQLAARQELTSTRIEANDLTVANRSTFRNVLDPNNFNNPLRDAQDKAELFAANQDVLTPGIGMNAAALRARIGRKTEQMLALEQERVNLKDQEGPDATRIEIRLKGLGSELDRAKQSLKNLATNADRVAPALVKLGRLNDSDKSRLSLGERFLSGDMQARQELTLNNQLAEKALQKGNFDFADVNPLLRPEFQRRALEGFNAVGNILLPGRGGETAAQAKERLLRNTQGIAGIVGAPQDELQQRKALQAEIQQFEGQRQQAMRELMASQQRTVDLFGTHAATFMQGVDKFGVAVETQKAAIEKLEASVNKQAETVAAMPKSIELTGNTENHVAVTGLDSKLPGLQQAIQQQVAMQINEALGRNRPSSAGQMERLLNG